MDILPAAPEGTTDQVSPIRAADPIAELTMFDQRFAGRFGGDAEGRQATVVCNRNSLP